MTDLFVSGFIRWWCHQEEGDFAAHLAEGFVYDGGMEISSREDFLLMRAGSGAIGDVKIIDLRCGDDAAAVMFEGTDSVTDLRHRIGWMISFDGDRIGRIVACSGTLPQPKGKPIWK